MERGKKAEMFLKVFLALIGAGMLGYCATFLNAHFARPYISCQMENGNIEFELNEKCRDAVLILHPQLMICYENTVILLVYLNGYYEDEFLKFDKEGKCSAKIQHTEYLFKFQHYLEEQITKTIRETTDIRGTFYMKLSSIGGVRYTNEKGNDENRYCIIEKDGLIFDYDVKDEEIENRLWETDIILKDDIGELEKDDRIIEIIKTVSEEVIKLDS